MTCALFASILLEFTEILATFFHEDEPVCLMWNTSWFCSCSMWDFSSSLRFRTISQALCPAQNGFLPVHQLGVLPKRLPERRVSNQGVDRWYWTQCFASRESSKKWEEPWPLIFPLICASAMGFAAERDHFVRWKGDIGFLCLRRLTAKESWKKSAAGWSHQNLMCLKLETMFCEHLYIVYIVSKNSWI